MEKQMKHAERQIPKSWVRRTIEWKADALALFLLMAFAFFVNRDMEIKGLYMDDLYQWYSYNSEPFLQAVFTFGGTRCRFLYNLVAWAQMAAFGSHVNWYVPFNIVLNTGIAYFVYRASRRLSRSSYIGILCGILFLASRMSYYQIGQALGLMESMAMLLALGILYLLYGALNLEDGREGERILWASVLYFCVCFVHERYMALLPLFFLVLAFRKWKDIRHWLAPGVSFVLVQLIRFLVIGTISPAGTGGTDVVDTISVGSVLRFAVSQLAYLFGINDGPVYLNGEKFQDAPLAVMILIIVADLMLLALVASFLANLFRCGERRVRHVETALLFIGFIGACIVCSSVTIRVELRWVYVSYTAALLMMAWMYGALTEGMLKKGRWIQALPFLAMITLYAVLALPVETYYRGKFPNLYYWADQERYNSLAEETFGNYGVGIFGKTIYVIGDSFEMEPFTEENFFRVFDDLKRENSTRIIHVKDMREFGQVTDEMLVIQEDPQHNRFQDVTHVVDTMKCRPVYGFYDDGWLDEKACAQVMAGSTGEIQMNFFYPRDLMDDQWLTVYVNDEPELYLNFTEPSVQASIQRKPYEVVTLRFESNFYVPNALEKRGDTRLALLFSLTAD